MARLRRRNPEGGFSMVEMLVALLFTGLLMAGMSQVFKSSLSNFYTSGETLSSVRRSRMSLDLLYDDLNTAGMYLVSLSSPPTGFTPTSSGFYIIPNQPVLDAGSGADDPVTADELYFYVDMPLSFEGRLTASSNSAGLLITSPTPPAGAGEFDPTATGSYSVDCGNASYAALVKKGQFFIVKDSWETLYITEASASGKTVSITTSGSPTSGVTGLGAAAAPSRFQHIADGKTQVVFFVPGQVLRYSLKMKPLDPDPQAQNPGGIPCLVRDQGTYDPAGFTADPALESIVAENVQGFKVYLSADAGQTWAGDPATRGKDLVAWDDVRKSIDEQVAAAGRPEITTTQGNESWFRKVPTLVRIDVTTRTATKRAEYNPKIQTDPQAKYKETTQTIVMVPRHFGLPIN